MQFHLVIPNIPSYVGFAFGLLFVFCACAWTRLHANR